MTRIQYEKLKRLLGELEGAEKIEVAETKK